MLVKTKVKTEVIAIKVKGLDPPTTFTNCYIIKTKNRAKIVYILINNNTIKVLINKNTNNLSINKTTL